MLYTENNELQVHCREWTGNKRFGFEVIFKLVLAQSVNNHDVFNCVIGVGLFSISYMIETGAHCSLY